MGNSRRTAVLLALVLFGSACSDDDGTGPADLAALERAAARFAVATLAVATGPQGASFLDNFLPCARRGVINYFNTDFGRIAAFSGCDLGDGVVVSGSGHLDWADSGLASERGESFCEAGPEAQCRSGLRWMGSVEFRIGDGSPFELRGFRIDPIVMSSDHGFYPEQLGLETGGLGLDHLRVTLLIENLQNTYIVDDPDLPTDVFGSQGMTIDAIPNPSGSLSALTVTDLKRVAYHGALALMRTLIDETLEAARGSHTHSLECGTTSVTFDPATNLPTVTNAWDGCESLGLFYSGDFTVRWGNADLDREPIDMLVEGELTLGGGVPTITINKLEWVGETEGPVFALPAQLHITGELRGPGDQLHGFDFAVTVDD